MALPLQRILVYLTVVCSSATALTDTDFIPCSDSCDRGDVNVELIAAVRTFPLMGRYTYRGRTYWGEGAEEETYMGPTMRVKPGQSLWIKLRNEIFHDNNEDDIGPNQVTVLNYWNMQQNLTRNKNRLDEQMIADWTDLKVDTQNIPRQFDVTNLHLHGLDVETHMFDPVGTRSPNAPPIAIHPGQCYCYKFNVPHHHPPGMYWYHPHSHGSAAVQVWSGMLGLLYVEGPLVDELAEYGVTRREEFVVGGPALKEVDKPTHDLEVDDFLMGQTDLPKIYPILVNGQITPNFKVCVNQVLHLIALCAMAENESTFVVYPQGQEDKDWNATAIPFYIIGSDGVTYRYPKKKTIIVMAGGQREEILLQFERPGKYVICQHSIKGMVPFDVSSSLPNRILATISVEGVGKPPVVPIEKMTFTPGYEEEESIQAHEIVQTENITFSAGVDPSKVPFPQYYVNDKSFSPSRLDFFAQPGQSREYLLVNTNSYIHPFHIHANRFQVKQMGSELETEKDPTLETVLDFDPDAWRDTVVVPPNGWARIWIRYKNHTGKTILHCHLLTHEDTGMMATLFIGSPDYDSQWTDYAKLGTGILCGIIILGTAALVVHYFSSRRKSYKAVAVD
eukprot:scaffold8828_cov204-Amphora_coffeaeformis.AAC.40